MVLPNESATTTNAISGFLQAVRSSCVLSEQQLEQLAANMSEGEYPSEPAELSARLVKDGVLTEFQARQFQKGKSDALNFGSYVILEFLGKGTMGKVYKARHRMMGRVVALKILDSRYVSSKTRSLARFQREMQLVGRLDHPNVVRAFDADRVADCYFIAMEYAAGFTLEDLLKARGALPPADVVYYGSQVSDGLAHAHARGVLHRDIKPSNLLVTEGRKLKILDFGLGTLLEGEETSTALTTAGMAVGTPDYISPEQARMVKLDGRSDLYSLGCTMYHLLSGQLPFKGESSMDCIIGRITGKAVPLDEARPGLPPRLVQSIEKMLATNPDDRYQTADDAAAALRSLLRPKNKAPGSPAATVAAIASASAPGPGPGPNGVATVPEPGPKKDATREAPSPPVRTAIRSPEPKRDSLRSAGTSRRTWTKRVAAVVAVAAVSLIVGAIVLRSSNDERPASQQEGPVTNNSPEHPADGAGVRPASLVVEKNPNQAATVATRAVAADTRRASLVIESPKPGATVSMREDLTGRIESEGWPVIFVQADIPGQAWWCQAPVALVDGGKFSTKIVFGDELTPSGTKFRIAGIVTRTREEALKFKTGSKELVLPKGVSESVEVVVTHR
jgi:eukaryotic-like serine/threonine-protein kinase